MAQVGRVGLAMLVVEGVLLCMAAAVWTFGLLEVSFNIESMIAGAKRLGAGHQRGVLNGFSGGAEEVQQGCRRVQRVCCFAWQPPH